MDRIFKPYIVRQSLRQRRAKIREKLRSKVSYDQRGAEIGKELKSKER